MNTWTPAARGSVRSANPAVLKVLSTAVDVDELSRWRRAVPRGTLIYRHYFADEGISDVAGRVAALAAGVAPIADLVDYVEAPWNESHQGVAELASYARATIVAVSFLHQRGFKVLVGNFSVGNPVFLSDWNLFLPALRVADGVSLHEYSSPRMDSGSGFMCLRYRDVYKMLPADCQKPLWITEAGIDWGSRDPQNGYQSHQATSPLDYAGQLGWYLGEVAKDAYVKGVVIFAAGVFDDFRSFDVAGVAEVEDQVRFWSGKGPGAGGKVAQFNVGAGVLALMAVHGDKPKSSEHYVVDSLGSVFKSETFGSKGIYQWNKAANETVLVPFG